MNKYCKERSAACAFQAVLGSHSIVIKYTAAIYFLTEDFKLRQISVTTPEKYENGIFAQEKHQMLTSSR